MNVCDAHSPKQEPFFMALPLDPISTAGTAHAVWDAERPALPDASVQVTASAQGQKSDSATQGDTAQDNPAAGSLNELNANMQAWATGLRFEIDPDAHRLVVSIIDSHSGEVLRTVPSEAVIRVAKMIVQLQGQFVDTKA
jgi:flagellar protein FlaG